MPNIEPVVIDGSEYSMRHIGPQAAVWPTTPNQPVAVLACTTMVARPLPMSPLPSSPDFVSGSWTGRLGDSGEATLTFPNREASDGLPWRQRFDPTGHLSFVEIYRNRELDFVGVIDQVPTIDQTQIQVHLSDGWFLLKKAYTRDWTCTLAPRDVIEHGTQVWVPSTVDNFPAGSLNAQWGVVTGSGGTVSVGASGGVLLSTPASGTATAGIETGVVTVPATGTWSASATVQYNDLASNNYLVFGVEESASGDAYFVRFYGGYAQLWCPAFGISNPVAQVQVATAASFSLLLESDGRWVTAFCNGQLVGSLTRQHSVTTSLQTSVSLADAGTTAGAATITGVLVESLQPFLMASTDKGDYVLPGDATTFPNGGLQARYFNDLDLQADGNQLQRILSPPRTQAYAGSGAAEYADQQDATINQQQNPTPGAATSNWSAVWFGAIYLKLSAGNYTFELATPIAAGCAVRVWVGQTQFGKQLVDGWSYSNGSNIFNFTVSATTLEGSLSYGGGTVARDGWYPIKVEYSVGSTAQTAPKLYMVTSPVAYTDPGGTSIPSGTVNTIVPSTSLSPLGCVDQRYQGIAHYDMVQQTVQAYDYQASVEPQQLEAGLFPGVLAPRIREGHDTDIALQPDRGPRQDGEGILNYSSGLDATDFASSLQGNGAGLQNGTSGQLQAMVYDAPTMESSLFDVQQWQDFSDASLPPLLQALLNAQLAEQLEPWQLLSADPTGSPRLANTWPLPGALAKMRWRPGDGMRIQARDINVWDTSPRQMLTVTPSISPNGKTGTQVNWALRPRTPARTLKRQLYTATRWQRNYQRQLVSLNGAYLLSAIGAGATDSSYSIVALSPGDTIVRAWVRVASAAASFDVYVNGIDQTSALKGPWSGAPVNLDITAFAEVSGSNSFIAQLHNNSGGTAGFQYQLLVDVLR